MDAEEIVALLAKCGEPSDSEFGYCVLCEADLLLSHRPPHEPNCPWLLAQQHIAAKEKPLTAETVKG